MEVKLKSVAYDLEGTVINVESVHHRAHIYSARDFGVTLSLDDCFDSLPHFIGGPDEEIAKEIAGIALKRGRKIDYESVLSSKRNHYNQLLKEVSIIPREGFIDFFNASKGMGLKYTIGSLTNREQALTLLKRGGLIDLFGYDNIVLREDVKRLKPAPDVWIETAKRAHVEPSDQLVFEDSSRGIQGAVEIGAYCIGMPIYNRPDVIEPLLKSGAKRIFMQWNEINPQNLISNINLELEKKI